MQSSRALLCELWKMIYGVKALSGMFPDCHILVMRIDTTLPVEGAATFPKNDHGYTRRAAMTMAAINAVRADAVVWPADNFRLSLIHMSGREQPGTCISGSADVFIDFITPVLECKIGKPEEGKFKPCTELAAAAQVAARFVRKVFDASLHPNLTNKQPRLFHPRLPWSVPSLSLLHMPSVCRATSRRAGARRRSPRRTYWLCSLRL